MPTRKRYLTRSTFIAIGIHIAVFALFLVGVNMQPKVHDTGQDAIDIVQAQVVDGAAIEQEKRRVQQEIAERERLKREEALRIKKQQEEKARLEAEAKQRAEEERQAKLKQAEEQKKQAEAARKKAEEEKKQAEIERQKAEEAKLKAEQERKQAEEARKKAEAELKRQEELQRQAEIEAEQKRQAEILEQEEAELRAAEEAEQREQRKRQLSSLTQQYIAAIATKVQSRWRKPLGLNDGNYSCTVYVRQAIGGFIEEVRVENCSGGDELLRRSVEEAVWKSDPLPSPPDDEIFQNELKLKFRPE